MRGFLLCLSLFACTSPGAAVSTLEKSGFTDIKTTGYRMLACSKDDTYTTGFTAKNPAGVEVSGVVCCGLFKSCTVRF